MGRRGQGALGFSPPIENEKARPRDAIGDDFVPVPGQELPAAGHADQAGAVAEDAAAVPVAAEIDLGDGMAGADAVEAGVAQGDRKGAGLEVGAAGRADVVGGVDGAAVDVEQPLLAGHIVLGADQPGQISLDVMGMALGPLRDKGCRGFGGERLEGFGRHGAMILDQAGDDFRRPVVDAFGRVTVDQDSVGIAAGDAGDLGQGILPALPEPGLVVVRSEIDRIAGQIFRVRRHEPDGRSAVKVGDDDQDGRPGRGFLYPAWHEIGEGAEG